MLPDPARGIARGPHAPGLLAGGRDRNCVSRTALAAACGSGVGPSLLRRGSFDSSPLLGSWPRPRGPCLCNAPTEAEFTPLGTRCERMYARALEAARCQDFEAGRTAFEELLEEFPGMCKAWVSYAQMEKRATRRGGRKSSRERWESVRQVLQRGMTFNPRSACLAQLLDFFVREVLNG
eukprot:evm.model.scf_387.5 EVM.evm.TU.scf_387.5   scf_387:82475-83755(-)